MSRVAVLLPTRNRPEQAVLAIESVLRTSKDADVLLYIDEDQADYYGDMSGNRVVVFNGKQLGPVASANAMVERCPEYDAYGLITDDSVITTDGWDDWLLAALDAFPSRLAVVSPHHNHGDHVDMPFVSREWIGTTGWFACPFTYHYAWPIITGLIGEMTAIVHTPAQAFHIQHDYDALANIDRREKDYKQFFLFVSLMLMPLAEKLRARMSA